MNKQEIENHRRLLIELNKEQLITIKKQKEKIDKIKELVKTYEELEQVLGAGKPRFPLYKLQEILGDKEK